MFIATSCLTLNMSRNHVLSKKQVADLNVIKANRVWRHIYKMALQIYFILLKQIFWAYIKLPDLPESNPFQKKMLRIHLHFNWISTHEWNKIEKAKGSLRKGKKSCREFLALGGKKFHVLYVLSVLGAGTSDTGSTNGKDRGDHRTMLFVGLRSTVVLVGVVLSIMRCILSQKDQIWFWTLIPERSGLSLGSTVLISRAKLIFWHF